jgi:hypothetical protein
VQLGHLGFLDVAKTSITAHGVARIQAALPRCSIRSDYPAEEIKRLVSELPTR